MRKGRYKARHRIMDLENIAKAKALRASGLSYMKIARALGVSYTAVYVNL
jgi:DNA invertase Pin-like site-specific DNA recombinase